MKALGVIFIVIWLVIVGCWVGNIVKLTDCDFQAPYECEIVHGIGIIPPMALITIWLETDN